ncbi:hypothetical protein L211DRAFT_852696 [Terfezia boudieri ATCC MYA-4762]|uniref:Uncharacterized protein n=1 Tax=Terfezia boudieri ATCC MYA-4762 TaxID=1051890 RepID=A0A3N4LAV5_9PEZI|nr:hypothetical protein L211DRAFT_852696 [Terfezia boudieri ATCC MYA-4762]
MGGKKNLFFPIWQRWDSNKVVAIIDGETYRTLESYSMWGKEKENIRQHIDAIAKGHYLLEKQDENLLAVIVQVDPVHLDMLIQLGKAALVTIIPEDQQINDTINVLPHMACSIPSCNKLIQLMIPEKDIDILGLQRELNIRERPRPATRTVYYLTTGSGLLGEYGSSLLPK